MLPLELPQLLLPILLQQLLELVPLLPPPFFFFFSFLLRLLLPLLQTLLRLPLALFLFLLPLLPTEWSPMGQGVCSTTGEASTFSSVERASFESLSPSDPSLIVLGSPSILERGGLGAPSCSWGRGASTCFGDGGVDSPTNGRGEALSTPVGSRGTEEPVSARKQKVSRHDDQHKGNTTTMISGTNR